MLSALSRLIALVKMKVAPKVQLLLNLDLDAIDSDNSGRRGNTGVTNGKPDVSVTLAKFDATYLVTGRTLLLDLKRYKTFYTAENVLTCFKLRCDRQKT
jgi:hypothetical protein